MNNLTAIVIGATGATGTELVNQLLEDSTYAKVKIFIRKGIALEHPKLEKQIVDFDNMDTWKAELTGDVLFSALGTTLKQAGSKKNQYTVDFTYQFNVAKYAAENRVKTYVLISSYGAKSSSKIFYSKMKGELEDAIKQLPFETIHIFQPGILDRSAANDRFFESLSVKLIRGINRLGLLKTQRPMPVATLGQAMRKAALIQTNQKINHFVLHHIFEL
jgi:uncharacterized protein YbjT (DUF2867 family)